MFCHVTNAPASRTLLVFHEGTTVAIGTSQSAWPVLEAATTVARTGRCTVRRLEADRFITIRIVTSARTIAIVAPVISIPKPGARAFEAVDQGDTLDTGGNSTICKGRVTFEASGARGCNISKTRLRILIEAGGESVEAKIRGKVAILKFLPVRVDM